MTKNEKIEFLRQLQKGGINREELLRQMGMQVIAWAELDPEPLSEAGEQSLQQWANDLGFIYDKKRQEVLVPYELSEEQEVKLNMERKYTTEELIEHLQKRHEKFMNYAKSSTKN